MPAPSGFEQSQAPEVIGGNERNAAQERSSTVKAVFVVCGFCNGAGCHTFSHNDAHRSPFYEDFTPECDRCADCAGKGVIQVESRPEPTVRVFTGTAREAQALLESLAYCQHVVAVGKLCGKPTPCEEHKPVAWNPRWSSERYGDTERAAFGKERG